jgi:hypothetical protein
MNAATESVDACDCIGVEVSSDCVRRTLPEAASAPAYPSRGGEEVHEWIRLPRLATN